MMFAWQQKGWPKATCNRAALRDEIAAFEAAFLRVRKTLARPCDPNAVMNALVDEAMKTSAIEGVRVDESVVMSSICKALGMKDVPAGFARDVRAEGVANMVLAVKDDWKKPISLKLIRSWHGALLANNPGGIAAGEFRSHAEPMRVIRRDAYGEIEIRYEAPPSARVTAEMAAFAAAWRKMPRTPSAVALKAAMLHPHFEAIHPFEDGNGRVGRALVAKAIAEGLGAPLVLPVSTVIARHRNDYYEAINAATRSLDWTDWAKFFIPVLTETLADFVSASRFVAEKSAFLAKYEGKISARALAVVRRMFRDGPAGVAAGLSAAKWMRMAKVSKPTATRDLEALAATGAIVREGESVATRYRLDFNLHEPHEGINEGINIAGEPLCEPLFEAINEAIKSRPGIRRPELAKAVGKSRATVERAIAALVKTGRIEHRGSKKTGGYFANEKGGPEKPRGSRLLGT